MKTLDEIAIHYQTDKASQFSRTYAKPHDYCRHIERFFEPLRDKPVKLLEVGVGSGESIRSWLEYFPNAHVYGVDIVSNTNPWNTPGAKTHERYTFACGDQSKTEFWNKFVEVYGGEWSIICDDGSHLAKDIRQAFASMWPHVNSGGLYEIEDLNFDTTSIPWTQTLVSYMHSGILEIDSIYFARELAILRKK